VVKILESIIRLELLKFVDEQGILNDMQMALSARSPVLPTCYQLLKSGLLLWIKVLVLMSYF